MREQDELMARLAAAKARVQAQRDLHEEIVRRTAVVKAMALLAQQHAQRRIQATRAPTQHRRAPPRD